MTSLDQLPNELITQIAADCDLRSRAALALTSRRNHEAVNPVLYKANINQHFGCAMLWAARHGSLGTLERLVTYGAEVNDTSASLSLDFNVSPYSSILSDTDHASFPLRRWDPFGFICAPLAVASKYGQDSAVAWLLDHGARVDTPAQNLCACQTSVDPHQYSHEGTPYARLYPFWTPLHLAACNGHLNTVKLLIARGADPLDVAKVRSGQSTALHAASCRNRTHIIEYLVRSRLVNIEAKDARGRTALHWACLNFTDVSALKKLVELGASLESRAEGMGGKTAFAFACRDGYFKAALYLLEKGVNHRLFSEPFTPLHLSPASLNYLAGQVAVNVVEWENDKQELERRLAALGAPVRRLDADTDENMYNADFEFEF